VRRITEALRRIARPAAYEARLPTSLHAELAEMLGAAPAAQPVIPPLPGEQAKAAILARHGHLAYINTSR